jgi:Protein of unknown function (DUF1569)
MRTLARPRDRGELLERLARLRPDSPRQWGRMSAPEMVCHLTDAFRMAMGDKPVSDASSLSQRTVVKWAALYLPVPWPTGVLVTRPEIAQGSGGTCPGDFDRDLADLVAAVERFTAANGEADWPAHPIFGPLTRRAWMRWGYLHVDHHLRQFSA